MHPAVGRLAPENRLVDLPEGFSLHGLQILMHPHITKKGQPMLNQGIFFGTCFLHSQTPLAQPVLFRWLCEQVGYSRYS